MIENGKAADEAQIRKLMANSVAAIRAKDVDGGLSPYAPGVLSFDVVDPLRSTGADAVRERLAAWFSSFQGPLGYEIRDLSIATGDDVAFCHSLNHISATTTDGAPLDMWWRATLCFRKIDGAWKITHDHSSVPFDVESGQASIDLTP